MTESQAARVNCNGHPCPPWCVIDHDTPHSGGRTYEFHGAETASIAVPGKVGWPDRISARAVHSGQHEDSTPCVSLSACRYGRNDSDPSAWLRPGDARDVAGIIDMLAGATKAQHRELAAAIRKAAADITEGETDGR